MSNLFILGELKHEMKLKQKTFEYGPSSSSLDIPDDATLCEPSQTLEKVPRKQESIKSKLASKLKRKS